MLGVANAGWFCNASQLWRADLGFTEILFTHTDIYIYIDLYRDMFSYIYIYLVTHSNFKKMPKRVSRMVSIGVLHVQYTPVRRKAFPKLAMRADAAAHPFPLAGRLGGGPVGCVGTILSHIVTPGNR
jgi:hypothetical protein